MTEGDFFSTMTIAQSIRKHSLEGKEGFESDRRWIEAPARKELGRIVSMGIGFWGTRKRLNKPWRRS